MYMMYMYMYIHVYLCVDGGLESCIDSEQWLMTVHPLHICHSTLAHIDNRAKVKYTCM